MFQDLITTIYFSSIAVLFIIYIFLISIFYLYYFRNYLSKLVNLVANCEIDVKTANSIVYITNAILTSIRVDEQEQQIQELKHILEDIQNGKS